MTSFIVCTSHSTLHLLLILIFFFFFFFFLKKNCNFTFGQKENTHVNVILALDIGNILLEFSGETFTSVR
jgi:hypothetical protein